MRFCRSSRRCHISGGADLQKMHSERLELVDHPVEGGLVQRAGEQRVGIARGRGQGREGLHQRGTDGAADADLVAAPVSTVGPALLDRHMRSVAVGWMSAHRMLRVNPTVWHHLARYHGIAEFDSRPMPAALGSCEGQY